MSGIEADVVRGILRAEPVGRLAPANADKHPTGSTRPIADDLAAESEVEAEVEAEVELDPESEVPTGPAISIAANFAAAPESGIAANLTALQTSHLEPTSAASPTDPA